MNFDIKRVKKQSAGLERKFEKEHEKHDNNEMDKLWNIKIIQKKKKKILVKKKIQKKKNGQKKNQI